MDYMKEFIRLQTEIVEIEKRIIHIQEKQVEILSAISKATKPHTKTTQSIKCAPEPERLSAKDYFKKCVALAKRISEENPDEYHSPNSVLRHCYKRLDKDYSCGLEIKKYQFAKEHGYTPKNTLDMISKFDGEWEIYRSVFLSILEGMCDNQTPIVVNEKIGHCETWDDLQSVLHESCGDTPVVRARLLRKVYADMDETNTINWASFRYTYRKRHNYPASRPVKKIAIISESRKLQSYFLKSFNKVVDMEENENGGTI